MSADPKKPDFKALLESQHEWPCQYLFKFIVPKEQQNKVTALFPGQQIQMRASSGGKYLSISVSIEMESPDVVIAVYEKASRIEGLIAL